MNSYLNELSRLLANAISPEEYNNVMQYYTEYFADAGIEKEEEVIKELGTPAELAQKIIAEYNGRQHEDAAAHKEFYAEPQPAPAIQSQQNVQENVQENVVSQTEQMPVRPRRRLKPIWIVLIVIGAVITGISVIGYTVSKVKNNLQSVFKKVAVDEQKYMVLDEFETIDLELTSADVEIVIGDEYAVEYLLGEDAVLENNGKVLKVVDDSFHMYIANNINKTEETYIKIYVPEDAVLNLDLNVDVGNIKVSGINFDSLELSADVGSVNISGDSDGGSLVIEADIGDVEITGFLACDMEVVADIGDVKITTYYVDSTYDYDVNTEIGNESINKEGGAEIEGNYDIDVDADLGDVTLTFCND